MIEAEATEAIGAGRYQRCADRGTPPQWAPTQEVSTTAGDIEGQIPKLRAGSFLSLVAGAAAPHRRGVACGRLDVWPFLSWCFAAGRVVPDLELIATKGKGAHFSLWASMHSGDVVELRAAAASFE